MDRSDSLRQPVVAAALTPVLIIIIEVGWNAQQIFTGRYLRHPTVVEFDLCRPDILPVIQDHKESVIASCQSVEGLPSEI
mmetsp:Transcript_1223/g.1612  ORF Transcript_1223/g.1612 Transcript_1223/m.1612 type:complete len:80 (+) Transcript_1223:936-1175(+)